MHVLRVENKFHVITVLDFYFWKRKANPNSSEVATMKRKQAKYVYH